MGQGKNLLDFRKKTILDIQKANILSNISPVDKRKFVRIVAIDDEEFKPLKNLLADGFLVGFIEDHAETRSLRPYQVVICDVDGIAKDKNSEEHGAAFIQEIKRVYPEKQIIVFSGLMGNVRKLKLARERADFYIPKSAQLSIWNETLDSAIDNCLNPEKIWESAKTKLEKGNVSTKEIAIIEDRYVRSVLNQNPSGLHAFHSKKKFSDAAEPIVLNLISSIIWTCLSGVPA